jgi:hypothetical protein
VGEEVFEGDRLAVGREVRQETGDRVGKRELAALGEEEDRGGGELLGDRADLEDVLGRDRHAELDVGEPVALRSTVLPWSRTSTAAPGSAAG